MGARGWWLVLAVVAAAVGGWWLLRGDGDAATPPADPVERADAPDAPRPVLTPAPSPPKAGPAVSSVDPPTKPPPRPRRTGFEGAIPELPREVGRLEGNVRDADGNPVAGASVHVMRPPTIAEVEERRRKSGAGLETSGGVFLSAFDLMTDAQGRFLVDGVPHGIQLFVRVESSQGSTWAGTLERLGAPLEISLPRTLSIRGRVLDAATGFPAEGLRVLAAPQGGTGMSREARSGARGEFEIASLPSDDYLVEALPMLSRSDSLGLDRELPPPGMEAQARVRVAAGAEDVELRLWRGYTITGRLETQEGRAPGSRVEIRIYARSAGGQADQRRQARATTAGDGTFSIDALPAGAYELLFEPPADATATSDAAASTWLHDVRAPAVDLLVVLQRGVAIRGRMVDEQGRAVTGTKGFVYVLESGTGWGGVHSLWATLDGLGGFSTPPVSSGRAYELLVRGFPGLAEANVADVFPGTEVVVRLQAARQIHGRVRTPEGDEPGASVPVVAWAETGSLQAPGAMAHTSTDAQGRFVLDGLTSERYRVAAGGGGSAYAACEPAVGVAPGAEAIEVTLVKGAPISGRLVDPRGNAVQTQTLQASGIPGGMRNHADLATTRVDDAEGRFLIPGLRPGRVHLLLYRDGKSVLLGEVVAPAKNLKIVVPDP